MSLPNSLIKNYNPNSRPNQDYGFLNNAKNVNNSVSSMYGGPNPYQKFQPVPQLVIGNGYNQTLAPINPLNQQFNTGFNPAFYAKYPTNNKHIPNPVSYAANIRNVGNYGDNVVNNQLATTGIALREPTNDNPLMNVPISAYNQKPLYNDYDRYLEGAEPNTSNNETRSSVEKSFVSKLFQNAGDMLFDRNNSQRQWFSEPNGSVPNDQTAYAESLYGNDYVCKSGSIYMRYGVQYTDDSLRCTGNDVSTPTNMGKI